MPLHDRIASLVNLAIAQRAAIDFSKLETPVQTHMLALLLDTLIELGRAAPSPLAAAKPRAMHLEDSAPRTVAGLIAQVKVAENERNESATSAPY